MQVNYKQFKISLDFEKSFHSETYPIFIIRSIIGMELKNLYCASGHSKCESCLFSDDCIYADFFESMISKNNEVLPGRERACHPWSVKLDMIDDKRIVFTLVLIKKPEEYIKAVYETLRIGGRKGFGKEKIPFIISSIICDGKELIENEKIVYQNIENDVFKLNQDCSERKDYKVHVDFLSPMRLIRNGKLSYNLEPDQFLRSENRRIRSLIEFYGDSTDSEKYSFGEVKITNKDLKFMKLDRWSSRQKKVQNLGGLTGFLEFDGKLSEFDLSLLKAAEIFSVGKNTNFGLGYVRISVYEKI